MGSSSEADLIQVLTCLAFNDARQFTSVDRNYYFMYCCAPISVNQFGNSLSAFIMSKGFQFMQLLNTGKYKFLEKVR